MKSVTIPSLVSVSTERSVRKGTTVRSVKTYKCKSINSFNKRHTKTAESMHVVHTNQKVTVPTNIWSQKKIKNKKFWFKR